MAKFDLIRWNDLKTEGRPPSWKVVHCDVLGRFGWYNPIHRCWEERSGPWAGWTQGAIRRDPPERWADRPTSTDLTDKELRLVVSVIESLDILPRSIDLADKLRIALGESRESERAE